MTTAATRPASAAVVNGRKGLSVLVLAPFANPNGVGESYSGAKWVECLSNHARLTVLTCDPQSDALRAANPGVDVVSFNLPSWLGKLGRINWMLKPGYWIYYYKAKRWIMRSARSGTRFDLVHQVTPLALRYASPGVVLEGTPLVVGPLAGSLNTPPAFRRQTHEPWWVRLRALDGLRMRLDRKLRGTYQQAALVLGAAPYVERLLPKSRQGGFEVVGEVGIDRTRTRPARTPGSPVRFLFVGRLVPTKGVGLLLRAVEKLADRDDIWLDVVGQGPQFDQLAGYVAGRGLGGVVTLHGRVPRQTVDAFYQAADVFVFPSYREPSGHVVVEAMAWGLPMIVADYGGPGANVPSACGFKIAISDPDTFTCALAKAMRTLADDADARARAGVASAEYAAEHFLWTRKAQTVAEAYRRLLWSGDTWRNVAVVQRTEKTA